ncbi:hypothetical protein [Sphingomonas sp. BK235]|uniref:hypothetical protein n=1 Tax=Sphingomonas sp. BK235 TaxID=2512131 RepID=UPI0010CEBE3B|nr:hypothetical protein [Sphingomonas sp. BK235]TCP30707.1 hypothetical protein EV292_11264 [Sphingomonas sp. BK235]
MQLAPQTLSDLLSAGHPDTAIVGVTLGTLRALLAAPAAAAGIAVAPIVAAVTPTAAA